MTWDEPQNRGGSGPRVVEPAKPEDRFGREDPREPDLFSTPLPSPASRPTRPAYEPISRPRSPSSVLAKAGSEPLVAGVDLDVPTFDRRGFRPTFDSNWSSASRDARPGQEAEIDPRPSRETSTSNPSLHDSGLDDSGSYGSGPSVFDAPRDEAPRRAPEPAERDLPLEPGPIFELTPAPVAAAEAEPDLPFHSSSSDPAALDTIAYLTNELSGHIAAFGEPSEPQSVRRGDTRDAGLKRSSPARPARTWVDTTETQVDDLDLRPVATSLEDLGLPEGPDLDDDELGVTEPLPPMPSAVSTSTFAPPVIVTVLPAPQPLELSLPPLTGELDDHEHEHDHEPEHELPRRPAIATFVIERPAAATASEPTSSAAPSDAAEAKRAADRAHIDWGELRAARARDWAAFDAATAPPVTRPAQTRSVLPAPTPAPTPVSAAPAPASREITPPPAPVAPPRERVSPPVVTRAPAPFEEEVLRPPARGWDDVRGPRLLDEIDEPTPSPAGAYEPALFTTRALAFSIDLALIASFAIVAVLLGVLAFGLGAYKQIEFTQRFRVLDQSLNWLLLVTGFVYFAGAHAWSGATVGKSLLGLRVMRADLSGPITPRQALVRTLGYAISFSCLSVGFLWALKRPWATWHDLLTRTVVVRAARPDHS